MDNTKSTHEKLQKLDTSIRYQLDIHRKIHFGEVMTIIESLGLDEKQYNAVKSLIGKEIQRNYWEGINMIGSQIENHFGYTRTDMESVEPLV